MKKVLEFFAKNWLLAIVLFVTFMTLGIYVYEGYFVFAFVAAIYVAFSAYQSYDNRW